MNMLWYDRLRHERDLHGWSQANVAEMVECDSKTVRGWEKGKSFPQPYYRQKLAEIFGKSAEELGLVKELASEQAVSSVLPAPTGQPASGHLPRLQDWGEAPEIVQFYGREREIAAMKVWMLDERYRMVLILGIGGVGKTTFATMAAKRFKRAFEYVFWRSLRNAPPVESLLESCLQFFPEQRSTDLPKDLDRQIGLLLTFLREHRCLLIMDNVESVFKTGQRAGRYAEGYEGYGKLFQRLGEANHQSCILLTSREKPAEIVPLEGPAFRVGSFLVSGIEQAEGQLLLQDKQLVGSEATWSELVALYSGNPLALKLIAEPIREMFDRDIARFLSEEERVFGDTHELLEQQFERLSEQEQQIMYWLGIEREALSLGELRENIKHSGLKGSLLDALESLRRRSLIEANGNGGFALQQVVMEYVTRRFVKRVGEEIAEERIELLGSHPLIKAQAKDYIRNSQMHLMLAQVVEGLLATFGAIGAEKKLKNMLTQLRLLHPQKSRYAAGNILNLLVHLGSDLRGIDFSHLSVWQACLQNVALPEVNFAYADLTGSVFADTFSSILCLTVSPDGKLLAAGTTTSEVRLWRIEGGYDLVPLLTCTGHTDGIRSVAFSPDGKVLVSGSEDQSIRFWDSKSGVCLKTLEGHTGWVRSISFSADGTTLASCSEDQTVRLWDVDTGDCLHVLQEHTQRVRSVAFSPVSKLLASGSDDATLRLWDGETGQCRKILRGHANQVRVVSFSPTGKMLVSGSEDKSVRLWDVETGYCQRTLQGHSSRIWSISFSSDGKRFASSDDQTIRLWDVATGQCLKVLQEQMNRIWALAFVPQSALLISASEDQSLRFWDTSSGQCIRSLQGYTSLIKSIVFSPDGRMIADGTEEQIIQIWDIEHGRCLKTLQGHANRVKSVAFSPDGNLLASGSEDETVRLWDIGTGHCLRVLPGHAHLVRCVAFHPNGKQIVSSSYDQTVRFWDVKTGYCLKTFYGHEGTVWWASYSHKGEMAVTAGEDRTVRLWDIETEQCIRVFQGHEQRVWCVVFSPDDRMLASASEDQTVRVWDAQTGQCLRVLRGHSAWTRTVAFSPDGTMLASGSHDQTIRLWDVATGDCLHILRGHSNCVWSVAFSPTGKSVASAGDDGTIRLWDVRSGECYKVMGRERPYEGMNIAHVKGLRETHKATLKSLGAVEV